MPKDFEFTTEREWAALSGLETDNIPPRAEDLEGYSPTEQAAILERHARARAKIEAALDVGEWCMHND